MSLTQTVILGCGDVGRRITWQLIESGYPANQILAATKSAHGASLCAELGLPTVRMDLDQGVSLPTTLHGAAMIYLVPPQKGGTQDLRSLRFIQAMEVQKLEPAKVVLISTTGIYGDCNGEWVTEQRQAKPQTDRARRRLNAEQQWWAWSEAHQVSLNVLRTPAIYAHSRISRRQIEKAMPPVVSAESGFTNRIHADDLATIAIAALRSPISGEIFNVSDGSPGTIAEYLQAAALVLGLPYVTEASMQEASQQRSVGRWSYVGELRRINNRKMLKLLNVTLRYADFRIGLRH